MWEQWSITPRSFSRAAFDVAGEQAPARLLSPTTWYAVFAAADQAVAEDSTAGLTTLVAFCIDNGHICASNGDSAAVISIPNATPNILTAAQCKNPPVGSGDAAVVPFSAKLTHPWVVLVMSDGVWKYAGWENV